MVRRIAWVWWRKVNVVLVDGVIRAVLMFLAFALNRSNRVWQQKLTQHQHTVFVQRPFAFSTKYRGPYWDIVKIYYARNGLSHLSSVSCNRSQKRTLRGLRA
jgi:hypothetical protein